MPQICQNNVVNFCQLDKNLKVKKIYVLSDIYVGF